jgi:N-acetylglucosaminyl-diphospho-decaprenol L-rhamnosyltransferase
MTPTIVIATRNRRPRLLATLARLEALPERPSVVVVDAASSDGAPAAIRRQYPDIDVIECQPQVGAAARTLGVEAAKTPLIAFSDDDSWWDPGALRRATELFRLYPRLGLIAARIVVEPRHCLDPTCQEMRESPLSDERALPGPAAAGWGLAYVDEVVVHHEPASGPRSWQGTTALRNELWSTWLRRPLPRALGATTALATRRDGMRALAAALRGLPWVLRERRVVPPRVERGLRLLEKTR